MRCSVRSSRACSTSRASARPAIPSRRSCCKTLALDPVQVGDRADRARRALHVRRAGRPPPAPPRPQDRPAAPSGLDRRHRRFGDQHEFRPHHPAQPDGQRVSEGAPDHHSRRRDGDRRRPMRRESRGAPAQARPPDRRGRGRCGLRPRRRDHRDRRGGIGDADSRQPRRDEEEPGARGGIGGQDQRRPRQRRRRPDLPRRQLPRAWSRIPAPTTRGSFRWSGCRSRRRSRSAIRSC